MASALFLEALRTGDVAKLQTAVEHFPEQVNNTDVNQMMFPPTGVWTGGMVRTPLALAVSNWYLNAWDTQLAMVDVLLACPSIDVNDARDGLLTPLMQCFMVPLYHDGTRTPASCYMAFTAAVAAKLLADPRLDPNARVAGATCETALELLLLLTRRTVYAASRTLREATLDALLTHPRTRVTSEDVVRARATLGETALGDDVVHRLLHLRGRTNLVRFAATWRLWLVTNWWWKAAGVGQHAPGGTGERRSRDEFLQAYGI